MHTCPHIVHRVLLCHEDRSRSHYRLCPPAFWASPAQSAQPVPAPLAELRLQGHTRPSGEVADSADARGNKASGCKAQLELNLMSWNKIHQSLQPETAFFAAPLFVSFHKFFVLVAAWKPECWQPSRQTDRWNIFITVLKSFGPQFIMTLHTAQINQPVLAHPWKWEKETFTTAVCCTPDFLLCITILQWLAHLPVHQRWLDVFNTPLQYIAGSVSVVVTSVDVAVSSFSAACISVFRQHSLWHWALRKGPCTAKNRPRTGQSSVITSHQDNRLMRWHVLCTVGSICALSPGLCVLCCREIQHWLSLY